ncbi:hypothetical protein SAMN04488103_101361 [Gemmobacter aquatilis]|uniref:Uncharacterized protein n=1 Tax=Gemmobacter aquatilis TaxID=933059 RepID=A0A1H7Z0S9_9RHOB|nr:hypothetical protein [Gemmobacter aquatilis]SEM51594.1 hypothetical protein SAMN04488103_101361 [Gemmobacter aquatilis]
MSDPIPLSLQDSRKIAQDVVARAPQDLVFTMRFLGQSQELLHSHFRAFLERALAEAGVTVAEHPLLPFFIDSHAVELRDFVFTGVSLARQFRLPEIETLTGDAETMLRVDIWDALANHIDMAEARFSEGITRVVTLLMEAEGQIRGNT